MTLYQWLLFGHVLAAIVWVGGGILDVMLARRMSAKGEVTAEAFAEARAWTGSRIFGPAAFAVLIFGILLVVNTPAWSFSQAWVLIALILVIALLAIGAGYHGPEEKRLEAIRRERGASDPEYRRRTRRLEQISQLEILSFIVIVFLMIFKPGV